jgi:hypothetical protein
MPGKVTHVDLSLTPPSYQIETTDGVVRDTERPRLRPRRDGEVAPATGADVASCGMILMCCYVDCCILCWRSISGDFSKSRR